MAGVEVVPPKTETQFSWLRTRLSVERTLMSWVRTGTALIGFGFTIFQFFERLKEMPGVEAARLPRLPRLIALSLIGIGAIGLLVAILEYRQLLRYLRSPEYSLIAGIGDRRATATPAFYAAILLMIVGIAAFAAVFFRAA